MLSSYGKESATMCQNLAYKLSQYSGHAGEITTLLTNTNIISIKNHTT